MLPAGVGSHDGRRTPTHAPPSGPMTSAGGGPGTRRSEPLPAGVEEEDAPPPPPPPLLCGPPPCPPTSARLMERRPVYTAGGGRGGGGPYKAQCSRALSPAGGGRAGRPAAAAAAKAAARSRRDQVRTNHSSRPAPATHRTAVTWVRALEAAPDRPVRSPAHSGPAPGQAAPSDVPRVSRASPGTPGGSRAGPAPHTPQEPTRETSARPVAMGEGGRPQAGGMPPVQALCPRRADVRAGARASAGGRGPEMRLADRSIVSKAAGSVQLPVGKLPPRGAAQPDGVPRGEQARDTAVTAPFSQATPAHGQQPGPGGSAHARQRGRGEEGEEEYPHGTVVVAFHEDSLPAGSTRADRRARREATEKKGRGGRG